MDQMDNARLHQQQAEARQQDAAKMGIQNDINQLAEQEMEDMGEEPYGEEMEGYDQEPEYNPLRG